MSLGVENFIEKLVKSVLGPTLSDEEWDKLTSSWTKRCYDVPMNPKVMLKPTPEGEKIYTKQDYPYRRVVGGSLWACNIRMDLCQTVRQLSRFSLCVGDQHVSSADHLLKYMWRNKALKLRYSAKANKVQPDIPSVPETFKPKLMSNLSQFNSTLYGGKVYDIGKGMYVDADQLHALKHVGLVKDDKLRVADDERVFEVNSSLFLFQDSSFQSTFDYRGVSGQCTMYANAAIDGGSYTQPIIATSTMESEVLATCKGTQHLIHIKTILEDLGETGITEEPTLSFEDNKSAKIILDTPGRRKGARHFERTLNKAHEFTKNGHVQYAYCPTSEMLADFFTKPLDRVIFLRLRKIIFNEED